MVLPIFMTLPPVADSFAGERERKTLESLLATRLPDHAIFLGKVMAVTVYALVMTYGAALLSLVTINLADQQPGVFLYRGLLLVMVTLGPLLMSVCVAGIGVFVSLKAKSVRTAMQKLRLGMIVVLFGIAFGTKPLAENIPPSWGERIAESAGGYGTTISALSFLLVLAVVGGLLLLLGIKRFQRHRLILE
jgi:ABC-2 type transport system permease protein